MINIFRSLGASTIHGAQVSKRTVASGSLYLALNFWTLAPAIASVQTAPVTISVNWGNETGQNKGEVTIQVCPEPPMLRDGPIHAKAHRALREFKANNARLLPWFPYPQLSMAALQAPSNGKTSWDFSLIDPIVLDFYEAAEGRPIMLNMAIPDWLFVGTPHEYPDDPYKIDWGYEFGPDVSRKLRDPTFKEVSGYFRRIAEWYIKGGFVDEYGNRHVSGHRLKFDYWEVLNEQEEGIGLGHSLDPETYTRLYDAVVSEVRKVDPTMKFSGLALADPGALHYFEYFLNEKNHIPGIPRDMVSFHRYIIADPVKYPTRWQEEMFEDVDEFVEITRKIWTIKNRLSPKTQLFISEWGLMWGPELNRSLNKNTIYGGRPTTPFEPIPELYWQTAGAVWAYGYLGAIKSGVDWVAAAELVNYPDMLAGTNLIHWETGEPNAVYHVAKMLRDRVRKGDRFVETASNDNQVVAQGFIGTQARSLLLINKSGINKNISLSTFDGELAYIVSPNYGDGKRATRLTGAQFTLEPYAVALLQINNKE